MRLVDAETLKVCGLRPADSLLVGLSGGADSVALLHSLCACQNDGQLLGLGAAHLHHGIRGASADADAAFCEALCREWEIPLVIGRVDAPGYAKAKGQSLELAARELRYAFLREQAAKFGADAIAVAHHADDQAETLLLHLMRGSGRTGLAGMRMRSSDIVRPLLHTRRRDIEAYLAENGLSACSDETNALLDAARNRVRHELLPEMERFNPRIREALCRLAAFMAADEDYLDALAQTALRNAALAEGYARRMLKELAEPIRSRALLRLLRDCQEGEVRSSDVRRVEALLGANTGSAIQLKGGRAAWLENDALMLGLMPGEQRFETPFIADGETRLPQGRLYAAPARSFQKPADGFMACVRASAIPQDAVVRTRRDGDIFFPFGAPGKKLLSDYLIDRKCPRTRRDMPLLCGGGEVLWVIGFSVSERLRVTEDTQDLLLIRYEEDGPDGDDAG